MKGKRSTMLCILTTRDGILLQHFRLINNKMNALSDFKCCIKIVTQAIIKIAIYQQAVRFERMYS
jgi:hypothetical protein